MLGSRSERLSIDCHEDRRAAIGTSTRGETTPDSAFGFGHCRTCCAKQRSGILGRMWFGLGRGEIPGVEMPLSRGDAHMKSDRDGAEREPVCAVPVRLRSIQIGQRLTLELIDRSRAGQALPVVDSGLIPRHELIGMEGRRCVAGERAVEP